MEKKKLELQYSIYDSLESLPGYLQELYKASQSATKTAYAPYSNFHVGAAILLENGEIVKGSNQENAAYPSGLCAERTAIFYVGSNKQNLKIKAIAVAATKNGDFVKDISPCGGCRQVMCEYEDNQKVNIEFVMPASNGKFIVLDSVKSFLPFEFTRTTLEN